MSPTDAVGLFEVSEDLTAAWANGTVPVPNDIEERLLGLLAMPAEHAAEVVNALKGYDMPNGVESGIPSSAEETQELGFPFVACFEVIGGFCRIGASGLRHRGGPSPGAVLRPAVDKPSTRAISPRAICGTNKGARVRPARPGEFRWHWATRCKRRWTLFPRRQGIGVARPVRAGRRQRPEMNLAPRPGGHFRSEDLLAALHTVARPGARGYDTYTTITVAELVRELGNTIRISPEASHS